MSAFAIFVVGAPGVGKTTALRAMFEELDPAGAAFLTESPKWTVCPGAYAAAGHYTGGPFDGADTVPYNGAAAAVDALLANLQAWSVPIVVFDGDRFSARTHLDLARGGGLRVGCVLISAPDEVVAQRRAARGSAQNENWARGRATKARNFFAMFDPAQRAEVDASRLGPKQVAEHILAFARGLA